MSSLEQRNTRALYDPMTIEDLSTKYPGIPWLDYLNNILPFGEQLLPSEVVEVVAPSFFEQLLNLLSKTPGRTIANYILWRTAKDLANELSEDIRAIKRKFTAVKTGQKNDKTRWKECLDEAQYKLPLAMGALYVRRWFDKSAKSSTLKIIQDIRENFEEIIGKVRYILQQFCLV